MSLCIDLDNVHAVLIAGVWYNVDHQSFNLDSYEFAWEGETYHGCGKDGVCAKGFAFTSNGADIAGPLTAIQAVSSKAMVRVEPRKATRSKRR